MKNVLEYRRWAGRGGEAPAYEVRCRAAAEGEKPDALRAGMVAAPDRAKAHDWRPVTADELASVPKEIQ